MAIEKTVVNQRVQVKKVYDVENEKAIYQTLSAQVLPSAVTAQKLGQFNEKIGFLMANHGSSEQPSNAYSLEKFLIEQVELAERGTK